VAALLWWHLQTVIAGGNQRNCPVFDGAYIRWSVMRRNAISGISLSSAGEHRCGTVSNTNANSTDLLSEHNIITCPPGGRVRNAMNWVAWNDINCSHCVTRT